MTAFADQVPNTTALVNCLFAMHHLPSIREVEQCLAEIRTVCGRTGCGFLIFDLARPRHASTAAAYPRVFTPDAAKVFCDDSTNSLLAAFSHNELKEVFCGIHDLSVNVVRARVLPLFQIYWSPPQGLDEKRPPVSVEKLSGQARWQYRALRAILRGLPR
ncbi:MAG TPA: hypothetical protein VFY73_01925 [Ideonella sp.]|uniref:hypothetical protein n=1 Tax=Ideonella sp. TaxID=1929293 RepID=UPI002E2F07AC|nr:hypothetical protein [Ideonella sp.]HEX5682766.1 hypothetical protein [Ideonella sp.]